MESPDVSHIMASHRIKGKGTISGEPDVVRNHGLLYGSADIQILASMNAKYDVFNCSTTPILRRGIRFFIVHVKFRAMNKL